MKKSGYLLVSISLFTLLMIACGGAGGGTSGPGKVSVHYKKNYSEEKIDRDFAVKKAFVTTGMITVPGATDQVLRYYITIADFDYDPQTASGKALADNQTSVEIDFFADKGAPEGTPIKPGTYQITNTSERPWNSYGKMNNAIAYTYSNGKSDAYSLVNNGKGTMKISSVTDTAVIGEIELTQENGGTLKATFNAQPFKHK